MNSANEGGSISTAFAAGLTVGAAFWGVVVDIIGMKTSSNETAEAHFGQGDDGLSI